MLRAQEILFLVGLGALLYQHMLNRRISKWKRIPRWLRFSGAHYDPRGHGDFRTLRLYWCLPPGDEYML